jgi:hypothetical protein
MKSQTKNYSQNNESFCKEKNQIAVSSIQPHSRHEPTCCWEIYNAHGVLSETLVMLVEP